ncbi:MAG: hemoglobin [Kiritimatiellia bacterium]
MKAAKKSLYTRIGGQPAIDATVDLFYTKVLADKTVNDFFEDVNMAKQHRKQKAFIAAAMGGPVAWDGKDMRKAHASLDLKESDF